MEALEGIIMHACHARFWSAFVLTAVVSTLAIGIAISALCASIAVSVAATDTQSSYQVANLSAKGDRLGPVCTENLDSHISVVQPAAASSLPSVMRMAASLEGGTSGA